MGRVSLLKKKTPEEKKVTVLLHYRNATEGEIGEERLEGITVGSEVSIDAGRISGKPNNNVDPNRITVRDSLTSVGSLVVHTTTGTAKFTAPAVDKDYAVYFCSLSNGADYNIIDGDTFRTTGSQLVMGTRYAKAHREDRDGQVCPDRVWFGSIGGLKGELDQPNDALHGIFGFLWGSVTQVSSGGDFGVGAGNCEGNDGWHAPGADWIGVNYDHTGDRPTYLVEVALAEGFEVISDVDNIGDQPSSMRIQHWGVFLPVGRDYFLYTFIKDKLGDK